MISQQSIEVQPLHLKYTLRKSKSDQHGYMSTHHRVGTLTLKVLPVFEATQQN